MSLERIAEEKIREAMDQGLFADLPGAGKTLRHHDDDLAGDDRMGLHILRENGFLPEWLELRKQVYFDRGQVLEARRIWLADVAAWGTPSHPVPARSKEVYRQRVAAINAKIDLHNVRCPSIAFEIARFRGED
jgi:hypothetical protein